MLEPVPLSPTSIRDLGCGFKYQELRLLRRWPKQRAQSTFLLNGRAAHAVFRELFDPKHGSNPPHTDRLEVALRRAVASEAYPDAIAKQMASGWISSLVAAYLDFHEPGRTVLAVEQNADFPLYYQGRHVAQVSARLDRVEVDTDGETLVVVDLACGDKPLHIHQAWMDLAVAKARYKHDRYKRYRLEIHSVTSDEVQVTSWKGADLKGVNLEVGALAAAFQEAVERDAVVASPCEACLYCNLKLTGRCPIQVPQNIEELGFDDEDTL